jgi:ankyrin repeat protein
LISDIYRGLLSKGGRVVVAALAALTFTAPARAQLHSDGFEFLKAVEKRDIEAVRKFLDAPGSTLVNSRDLSTKRTALHTVVEQRNTSWLSYLLAKGADPNLADNRGVTPLLLACRTSYIPGVEALVKAGARVDDPNEAGETPLISAVHARNTELMRVLLAAGANPDRADASGRTARDYAQLDGPQSVTLAEIARSAKRTDRGSASAVYGPVLRR